MASNRMKNQEPDKENNILHKRPPSGSARRLKHFNSSSLEILEPEDSLKIVPPSDRDFTKDSRPSSTGKRSNNVGSVPPRSDSSLMRRTPTPTKQISLQAVKRKEDRDDPIVADIDWKELQSHSRHKGRKEDVLTDQFQGRTVADRGNHTDKSSIPFSYSSRNHNCSHSHGDTEKTDKRERHKGQSKVPKESKKDAIEKEETPNDSGLPEAAGGKEESTSDTDSSEEEEEEERKAPNQLLMEFVTCLMEKDYPNAQKLCKMILLYEPDNPEALKFQPLIEEKIALDNEPEFESGESEGEEGAEDDREDDDEDDSDDDSEDSDSDSSDSDSEDSEDEDNDDEGRREHRLDSGIASAAGSD